MALVTASSPPSFFPTLAEALKFKTGVEREISPPPSRRLADVLTEWHRQKLQLGQCKPASAQHQLLRLRAFFASVSEQDIAALTPRRADALYQEVTQRLSPKTGTVPAAASHRSDLMLAQSFYRWATQCGYVRVSPFSGVKPIGRVNAGKPQLRIDEARRFTRAAVRCFEEKQQPLAIGVLLALTMGLRTSEVLRRVVRDLDDGVRYLWIDAGKTEHARRRLEVPELVQPYLRFLAHQKRPNDWLFGVNLRGGPHGKQTMWRLVRKLCRQAGVPLVCTHSLRGLWATLAVQSGSASHVVAANLGHHSFAMTERHYAQSSAVANAATARVLGVLGNAPHARGETAREQLERLDEHELTQLLELLAAAKKGGAPVN